MCQGELNVLVLNLVYFMYLPGISLEPLHGLLEFVFAIMGFALFQYTSSFFAGKKKNIFFIFPFIILEKEISHKFNPYICITFYELCFFFLEKKELGELCV